MNLLDVKGKPCPLPVIETKKAFDKLTLGESMEVVSDNQVSAGNIRDFIAAAGGEATINTEGNQQRITIKRTEIKSTPEAELFCDITTTTKKIVVQIGSNTMGNGDPELGKILLKGFINSLPELTVQPTHVIFLNSGIDIPITISAETETLKKLAAQSIVIMTCGTCLNFHEQLDKLQVGKVSNMYEIMEVLSSADLIIQP
jgi:selenium metabolism protein YedF